MKVRPEAIKCPLQRRPHSESSGSSKSHLCKHQGGRQGGRQGGVRVTHLEKLALPASSEMPVETCQASEALGTFQEGSAEGIQVPPEIGGR